MRTTAFIQNAAAGCVGEALGAGAGQTYDALLVIGQGDASRVFCSLGDALVAQGCVGRAAERLMSVLARVVALLEHVADRLSEPQLADLICTFADRIKHNWERLLA